MATRYVRSTDGSNADGGSTWALAKADLSGAAAIDSFGDFIYVSQSHAESSSSAQTWTWAGTVVGPVKIVCGNDGAEPPTAVATTATVTSTLGSGNAFTNTGNVYFYGIKFTWQVIFVLGNTSGDELQVYDTCQFIYAGGGSSNYVNDQASSGKKTFRFLNCQWKFDAAGESIIVTSNWHWRGGSVQAGTSTPTGLFRLGTSGRGSFLLVENFDFSACSSSLVLIDGSQIGCCAHAVFRNCKMPSSWSEANLFSGSIASPGPRYEMWNCDDASTSYNMYIAEYPGNISSNVAIYLAASDGTTGFSWKMVSLTTCSYPNNLLITPEIVAWNDTTGSSVTATVEIQCDTALTDQQIWLEVSYAGDASYPTHSIATDAVADILATPATQTTSTATWSGIGTIGSPQSFQKLQVTFTPQRKGPVYGRVCLARGSSGGATTVYVDPKMTIA